MVRDNFTDYQGEFGFLTRNKKYKTILFFILGCLQQIN